MNEGTTFYECDVCGQPRTGRNCFTCDYAAAKVEVERSRGGMYETIKKAHEDGYAEGQKDERSRVLELIWKRMPASKVGYVPDILRSIIEDIKGYSDTPKTEGTK